MSTGYVYTSHMPYTMRKVRNKNCFQVSKKYKTPSKKGTRRVFAKCSTRANSIKQMRLLRALEYNKAFTYKRRK